MSGGNISEAETRKRFIDKALEQAGWGPIVPFQENAHYDHGSVEEYPTMKDPTDYMLFHEGKALACVESKRVSTGAYKVLQQAKRYARGFPVGEHSIGSFGVYRIPFVYSTNGINIWFQDLRDPLNLSRQVSAFHRPNALKELLEKDDSTAKQWLRENEVDNSSLWPPFQIEALMKIKSGRSFTAEQEKWLDLIRRHLTQNLLMEKEDIDSLPIFTREGASWAKLNKIFGGELETIIRKINKAVAA
ncbi:MAG: hypothetical protein JRJ29_07070 [Deltaproteobacteria bacterium]|nr:hypothetical protein [Deltaproteobacteria bacterium]